MDPFGETDALNESSTTLRVGRPAGESSTFGAKFRVTSMGF